jgi:hypothetical protein
LLRGVNLNLLDGVGRNKLASCLPVIFNLLFENISVW